MNNLIDKARHLPINEAVQTISISPVTLTAPALGKPPEMRITAPVNGSQLAIVLLSHGHGPSLYIPSKDGYGPLANFYAEHSFVVIQPTHANSVAGLGPNAPGAPLVWRIRVEEMKFIVDRLAEIEARVPAIAGRLDHRKLAAVGHFVRQRRSRRRGRHEDSDGRPRRAIAGSHALISRNRLHRSGDGACGLRRR